MSLEQGGKTLGINNWKFNQGGFKEGVGVCARACLRLCARARAYVRLCSSPAELLDIICPETS